MTIEHDVKVRWKYGTTLQRSDLNFAKSELDSTLDLAFWYAAKHRRKFCCRRKLERILIERRVETAQRQFSDEGSVGTTNRWKMHRRFWMTLAVSRNVNTVTLSLIAIIDRQWILFQASARAGRRWSWIARVRVFAARRAAPRDNNVCLPLIIREKLRRTIAAEFAFR